MFGVPVSSMKGHKYAPLNRENVLEFHSLGPQKNWLFIVGKYSILILLVLVASGSGFLAGRWSASGTEENDDILHCR